MVVFPEESKFYTKWQHDMQSRGVNIRLNTEVVAIPERSSKRVRVQVRGRRPQPDHHNPAGADQDLPVTEEVYDEIVLCCLADTAKRLLGKTAGFMEKRVLGMTKWSDDITVTHNVSIARFLALFDPAERDLAMQDVEYMKKWYTMDMPQNVPTHLSGEDQTTRIEYAKKDFNP